MPCLRKCCLCVNLRVGGIMMGIMTLAFSLFSIISAATSLANRLFLSRVITHLVDKYNNKGSPDEEQSQFAFWGAVNDAFEVDPESSKLPPEDRKDVVWLSDVMLIFFIILIILLVVYAVCSSLLIYGAMKGRRWFILPWIIATLLLILAYIGGITLSLVLFGFSVETVLLLIFALVEIGVGIYLWITVISLFQVLENENLSNRDWSMKPKFNTSYSEVPVREQ